MTVRMKSAMPHGDEKDYDGLIGPSREWTLGDEVYVIARCRVGAVEARVEDAPVHKLAIEHVETVEQLDILNVMMNVYEQRRDPSLFAEDDQ